MLNNSLKELEKNGSLKLYGLDGNIVAVSAI